MVQKKGQKVKQNEPKHDKSPCNNDITNEINASVKHYEMINILV